MEIDGVITELNTKLRNFKQAWAAEFTERLQAKYVHFVPGEFVDGFQVGGLRSGDLRGGWGATFKSTSIEWYNTKDYASFVEWGTPFMSPQGQLRTTIAEHDQISEVAAKKVGLK
jgi:hypothetical protein